MLGKLLKYEVKSVSRTYLPIYVLVILMAVVNKILSVVSPSSFETPKVISAMGYGMVLFGIYLVTFFVSVMRFKTNLLGDEGYLMFTLPVSRNQLIMTKTISAVIFSIISVAVGLLSVFILLPYGELLRSFGVFFEDLGDAVRAIGGFNVFMYGLYMLAIVILSAAMLSLPIYLAMAMGQTANKNKLLASFGWYFVINFIHQTVITILFTMAANTGLLEKMGQVFMNMPASGQVHFMFFCVIAYQLVICALCYFLTANILTNKLNLE